MTADALSTLQTTTVEPRTGQRARPGLTASMRWVQLLLATAWVTVLFIAFNPGDHSIDSLSQLGQGIGNDYTNHHPPALSWLLGRTYQLFGSDWPYLLLQLCCLGGSWWYLARNATQARAVAAAVVLAVALCLPPVWSLAITVWKDVAMTAALLVAVALLRAQRPTGALVSLTLAALFRHNAAAPAAVLAVFAVLQLKRRHAWRWGPTAAAAALAIGLLAVSPKLVDRALGAKRACLQCAGLVYDLAAVYLSDPQGYEQSELAKDLTLDEVRTRYTPFSLIPFFYFTPGARTIDMGNLDPRAQALWAEWRAKVPPHFGVYLAHRFSTVVAMLGAVDRPPYYPFQPGIDDNSFGLKQRTHTQLYRALRGTQHATGPSWLFRGVAWLGFSVVLAVFAWRARRTKPLALWVAVSAWAYLGTFMLAGQAADFRFNSWLLYSVPTVALLLLAEPWSRDTRSRPVDAPIARSNELPI